jgi:hypothetical protein
MGLLNKIIWGRIATDIATIGKRKVPLSKVILGAYALEVVEKNHREQVRAIQGLEAAVREANQTPTQRAEDERYRASVYRQQELEIRQAKENLRIKLYNLDGGVIARFTLKYALRKAIREGADEEMVSMIRMAIREREIKHPAGDQWFQPEAQIALMKALLKDPRPVVDAMKLEKDPEAPHTPTAAMTSAMIGFIEKMRFKVNFMKARANDNRELEGLNRFEKWLEGLAETWDKPENRSR